MKTKRLLLFVAILSIFLVLGISYCKEPKDSTGGAVNKIVYAESKNRALIISIGPGYKQGIHTIVGPDVDDDLAREIADKKMGFSELEIVVLRDEQATRDAILDGLKWIKDGLNKGGFALVYFSGHGTQIVDKSGDELDNCDEAILPVDVTLENYRERVITDDFIRNWLNGINNGKMVFLVDSCHSGTMIKSIRASYVKFMPFKDSMDCTRNNGDSSIVEGEQKANVVVLTAAAAHEKSYGDVGRNTPNGGINGSLFTQGLYDAVMSQNVSFLDLRDFITEAIKNSLIRHHYTDPPHTPQLEGDYKLFNLNIRLESVNKTYDGTISSTGGNNELFTWLDNNKKFPVRINAHRNIYKVGEKISFSVIPTESGYLNIVELTPDRKVNVIFPNEYYSENFVKAGDEIKIPQDAMPFGFHAQEPAGKSIVYAVATKGKLNLYLQENANVSRELLTHKKLKKSISRSIGVAPVAPGVELYKKPFGANSITIEVIK